MVDAGIACTEMLGYSLQIPPHEWWVPFIPKCFSPGLLSSTQESLWRLCLPMLRPSLSSKGLCPASSVPLLWLPQFQTPPLWHMPWTLNVRSQLDPQRKMSDIFSLTFRRLPLPPQHTCLFQLSHPTPFHSFLPSPVALAIWWLS